nr:thermonuclease family protein [Rhodoferax sp.]
MLFNGQDVNLVQVERGMAWFYRKYQREQSPDDQRLHEAAEDAAKTDKRGLWCDAEPVPRWEFRHKRGKATGTMNYTFVVGIEINNFSKKSRNS